MFLKWLVPFLFFGVCGSLSCHYKDLTEERQISASRDGLKLWRSEGLPYSLRHVFTDVELDLKSANLGDLKLYMGPNCTFVQNAHANDNALFGFFTNKQLFRSNRLAIFNETFIGIDAHESYEISRHIEVVSLYRLIPFIVALVLFYFAPSLVRHAGFYYAGGVSTGLIASILVVALIVYRIAPKKVIGIPIILGGWATTAYMMQFAYGNLTWLIDTYRSYVIGYFAIWIVGALAYCYRSGPPTDIRSFNILQWALQAASCLAIYFSVQLVEVSFAIITLLILGCIFPKFMNIIMVPFTILSWFSNWLGLNFWRVPPHRFLTEQEYEQQGRETTEKELQKLRNYCKSPNADWRSISQHVSNPKRLARFADGLDDHVTDNEKQLYSLEPEISDDDEALFSDDDSIESRGYIGRSSRAASLRSAHTPMDKNGFLQNRMFRRNAATSSHVPINDSKHSLRGGFKVRRSLPVHRLDNEELNEAEISLLRDLESIRRQKHLNSSRIAQTSKVTDSFLDEDIEDDEDNDSVL